MNDIYDVIIIGGGPAGLSASVYAVRAGASVAVIERFALGGQLLQAESIENYPSVVSAKGYELAESFSAHAINTGANVIYAEATKITRKGVVSEVELSYGETLRSYAVIYAGGLTPKKLGLPREAELVGMGVSYCATCDGAFFKNKPVCVVGGYSALSSANYLLGIASSVTLITTANVTASGITVLCGEITSLNGTPLNSVTVKTDSGETTVVASGLFISLGSIADSEIIKEFATLDNKGFVLTDEKMKTSSEWLFACGDARVKNLRQVVTATSDGAIAGSSATSYARKIKKSS